MKGKEEKQIIHFALLHVGITRFPFIEDYAALWYKNGGKFPIMRIKNDELMDERNREGTRELGAVDGR